MEKLSKFLIDIPRIRMDTSPNIIPRALQNIPQRDLRESPSPGKDIEPMGKKLYPTDTLKQAQSILSAWKRIDPALRIGTLTLESITADVAAVEGLQAKVVYLQNELMNIRIQRDEATIGLWNQVKRTRAGFKGIYGDDSIEYKNAGGTRQSERKSPRRRPRPVSPSNDSQNAS